jgi:hypothetical protein
MCTRIASTRSCAAKDCPPGRRPLAPALSVEVAGVDHTARGRAGLPAIVRPAAARYTENLRVVLSGSSCASRDRL